MPGEGLTHGPPANKMQAAGTTGAAEKRPAFPARWSSRLYAVSLVRRACWPPSPREAKLRRELIPASGYQDAATSRPHISVRPRTRKHAAAIRGHRLPASRVVTIARYAPLREAGCA